jgi:hypothetical protein
MWPICNSIAGGQRHSITALGLYAQNRTMHSGERWSLRGRHWDLLRVRIVYSAGRNCINASVSDSGVSVIYRLPCAGDADRVA